MLVLFVPVFRIFFYHFNEYDVPIRRNTGMKESESVIHDVIHVVFHENSTKNI